jgi:putative sterol carrier protein
LSGLRKTISIRNQVAAISDDIADSCNISVKATEFDFKMAISGLTNPIMALATGDIEVDVSNSEFLNFLTYFR